MTAFFLVCAALGGGILLIQLALSAVGLDHGAGDLDAHAGDAHLGDAHAGGSHAGGTPAGDGLHLLSVRSLSAGLGFFGVGGLAGMWTGLGLLAAIPLAVVAGLGAAVAVAWTMRAMLRLEDDGTVQIEGAVGASGIVYLAIPGGRAGPGKVHLTLQNRIVELQAVTRQDAPLPTGARIMVVDVVGPDTVDVVPDPLLINEVSNVVA